MVQLCADAPAGAKLDALSVAAHFPSLSMADIEASLAALAAQGVLAHLPAEDRFVRCGTGAAASGHAASAPAPATRRGTRAQKVDAPVAELSHRLARMHAAGEEPAPPARGSKRGAAAAAPAEAPASIAEAAGPEMESQGALHMLSALP